MRPPLSLPLDASTLVFAVALGLALVSCGTAEREPGVLATADDSSMATIAPSEQESGSEIEPSDPVHTDQDLLVFADTVTEFCAGGDARIEMAFAAIITERSTRAAYGNIDSDDPADQAGRDVEWATFEVDTWYTDDLGAEIGLWAQDFPGQVGERWLVTASRYAVDGRPGGDVYWCASEPETQALAEEWAATYGGSVAPGQAEPETEPAPETLALLEDALAYWNETAQTSYTYTASMGSRETDGTACGAGLVRTVVVDGTVVQARDVSRHCDVPLDTAPTIDEMFQLAIDAAGAVTNPIEFDVDYRFVTNFSASDRSVERWIHVSNFTPDAYPLTTGGMEALAEARTRWQETGITSYRATIDVRCFCDVQGPISVVVTDGFVSEVSVEASQWFPLRVEEVFDSIEEHIGGDHVELAFHPEHGYPVTAILDPIANGSDDEIEYAITALSPIATADANVDAGGDSGNDEPAE